MRNFSMKKFGTPTGTGPGVATDVVGSDGAGAGAAGVRRRGRGARAGRRRGRGRVGRGRARVLRGRGLGQRGEALAPAAAEEGPGVGHAGRGGLLAPALEAPRSRGRGGLLLALRGRLVLGGLRLGLRTTVRAVAAGAVRLFFVVRWADDPRLVWPASPLPTERSGWVVVGVEVVGVEVVGVDDVAVCRSARRRRGGRGVGRRGRRRGRRVSRRRGRRGGRGGGRVLRVDGEDDAAEGGGERRRGHEDHQLRARGHGYRQPVPAMTHSSSPPSRAGTS